MKTFNDIITWIIAHKESIITGIVVELVIIGFGKTWVLTKKIPKAINILVKIKGIKYLGFIFLYALPLATITWMIVDNTNQPTFKNIALFILICVSLIFNILISHIRAIYKMMGEILEINSKNFSDIDSYAGRVNSAINELKEK